MRQHSKDTKSQILAVGRSLTAQRGYAGIGLSELLKAADVPKGSFYHYFPSKEAYGCALLEEFIAQYRSKLSETLNDPTRNAHDRLIAYFEGWKRNQTSPEPEDRCLVVKLSAEVADLSEGMSDILQRGVDSIVGTLTQTLEQGIAEGSIAPVEDPGTLAQSIYYQWLGASLIAGLSHDAAPLEAALKATTEAIRPA